MIDIENLPAGPELDTLISKNVMGSPKHQWVDGCGQVDMLGTYEGCDYCGCARRPERGKPDRENDVCVKRYSTDIAAAWEVALAAKKKFGLIELTGDVDESNEEFWWFAIGGGKEDPDSQAQALTAPLAICRAALKVISK